ncbi:MAG: DUF5018 domain-containing protein [Bacteroidota bacterium]
MKTLKKLSWLFLCCSLFFAACEKEEEEKSSECMILSFAFDELEPPVAGTIDQTTKSISLNVPYGTNLDYIVPTLTISEKATVSPTTGAAQNFNNPITYTVTAEDGTQSAYTVVINVGENNSSETLPGSIDANRTLVNRPVDIDYIIEGTLYVSGNALLTIEPGVKIMFTSVDGEIIVEENAGIRMVGTAANPIVLTGPQNNQNVGAWSDVSIFSNRSDNQMEYVHFVNGGSNHDWGVVNLMYSAQLGFNKCRIIGSANYGLVVSEAAVLSSFSENSIEKCTLPPIYMDHISQLSALDEASQLTNQNTKPVIYVNGGDIATSTNLTINSLDVPVSVDGITLDGSLTIDAGNTLMFRGYYSLFTVQVNGKLIVNGTSNEKVTLTRPSDASFNWQGLSILTNNNSSLNHCNIEHAGEDYASIYVEYDAGINLSDVHITDSKHYGIWLYDESDVNASSVTFSGCQEGNIYNGNTEEVSDSF